MAEDEPTMTVDAAPAQGSSDDGVSSTDSAPGPAFSFDEQTLGRSASVFDAGLPLVPPAAPPLAQASPSAEPPRERELSASERRHRVKLEARRVRRIVRHIELWSVLRISLIFHFCLWLILLLAGVLLWSFAESSGTLESVEELVEDLFALDEEQDFWRGQTIFRAYAIGTLILSIAGVTFTLLLCLLYNLISDLTGGVRVTMIEEETARFTPPRRRGRR